MAPNLHLDTITLMTPAELYALGVGGTIRDASGDTGTITATRKLGTLGDPYAGYFTLRWASRTSDSALDYTDPIGPKLAVADTSIFDHTQAPTSLSASGSWNCNMAARFQTSVAATVTKVWFYKVPADTGVHVATIWSDTAATKLATATFAGETASGWQSVAISCAMAANTLYRVAISHLAAGWAYKTGVAGSTNGILTFNNIGYYVLDPNGYPASADAAGVWYCIDISVT